MNLLSSRSSTLYSLTLKEELQDEISIKIKETSCVLISSLSEWCSIDFSAFVHALTCCLKDKWQCFQKSQLESQQRKYGNVEEYGMLYFQQDLKPKQGTIVVETKLQLKKSVCCSSSWFSNAKCSTTIVKNAWNISWLILKASSSSKLVAIDERKAAPRIGR